MYVGPHKSSNSDMMSDSFFESLGIEIPSEPIKYTNVNVIDLRETGLKSLIQAFKSLF